MYRLIIADDEVIVRNGLVNCFDWKKIGFEVVAEFEDGKDVLEYLSTDKVDVVFTDIQMFEVSGLEVAKWVTEHSPSTKVVLLSGYKEFDYVKEALKCNVSDYVLKPLSRDEIERVFLRVKLELDKEKSDRLNFFAYCESTEGRSVIECAAKLAESVCLGSQEKFISCFELWHATLNKVRPEYVSSFLFHLFDTIYTKLVHNQIFLPEEIRREGVFQKLSVVDDKNQPETIKNLLLQIVKHIYTQKHMSQVNIVRRANTYIDQHLSEDISVDDIASSMYISKSHFSREFKNQTGESVIDYVIRRRLEKAIELLKSGNMSQAMIAKQVGYSDLKYFQKSFKKYTGYAIKEYLRLSGNQIEDDCL